MSEPGHGPGHPVQDRRGYPRGPGPAGGPGDPGPDSLASALAAGRGQVVLVTGGRGTGRTRLARSVLDRARAVSDVVLVGHRGVAGTFSSGGTGYDPTTAPGLSDHGPGGGTGAPTSLIRTVARLRPDGPAARLVAEADADPGSVVGTTEELALALVTEAGHHPIAVLLEDVHLADEDTHAFVDHLLTVVDTVPVLLVATVATGWAARGPRTGRWHNWIGQYGVRHLPVAPPSRADLIGALRQVVRGRIPADVVDGILAASRGNPRVAQEMALWTLDGAPTDTVPATCLVHELVAAHDQDEILVAVALAGTPVGARLVAAVTSTSTAHAGQVLERARTIGLVDASGEIGRGDGYAPAHPMYAAAARALVSEERTRALHLILSSALIAERGDDPGAAEHIARHLVASGHPRADTASWCLRAATWCESATRLREATGFAHAGLDTAPDLGVRMELVAVLSRCYRRLGEPRPAVDVLRAALRTVSGLPRHGVPVMVELLELGEIVEVPGAEALLADAKVACPQDRPDLLARLDVVEAVMGFRRDAAAGRWAAERAVRAAESAGDTVARTRALHVRARTLMDPAQLGELEQVSARLVQQPGLDGLTAAAAAALAGADRGRLDSVLREYTWREGQWPDRPTRDELTLLHASVAAFEGRKAALARALLDLSATATPQVALATALLPLLWTAHTRGTIRAPVPDITGLPGAGTVAELQWLGALMTRPAALHPVEIELARQRLGSPADLARVPEDGTRAVRFTAAGVFGALGRDRDLCAVAVDALEPFTDQFVVLWPFLPIGPVGWFLAPPLRVLGRHARAASALAAAQEASENLGAPGWVLRAAAERARLLAPDSPPQAGEVVNASIGHLTARRFPGVVAETRCRLDRGPFRPPHDGSGTGDVVPEGTSRVRERVRVRGRERPAAGGSAAPEPPGAAVPSGRPGDQSGRPGQPAAPARASTGSPGVPALTPREADIMALAAVGCTNQEIAKRLFLSVATVERHCTTLYRRLGVRNRAQALGILGRFRLAEGSP